jgi:hypothetical protein
MSTTPQAQTHELDARACLSSYLILAGILVFAVLWLWSIRLKIVAGQLSYRILFWTRSIDLTDIEKAETRLFGTSRGQYRALVVYPRAEKTQKPMRVNIKVFSRKDLGRLLDLLGPKFQGSRRIAVYKDESA